VHSIGTEVIRKLGEAALEGKLREQNGISGVHGLKRPNSPQGRSADHPEYERKVMLAQQDLAKAHPWTIVGKILLPERSHYLIALLVDIPGPSMGYDNFGQEIEFSHTLFKVRRLAHIVMSAPLEKLGVRGDLRYEIRIPCWPAVLVMSHIVNPVVGRGV